MKQLCSWHGRFIAPQEWVAIHTLNQLDTRPSLNTETKKIDYQYNAARQNDKIPQSSKQYTMSSIVVFIGWLPKVYLRRAGGRRSPTLFVPATPTYGNILLKLDTAILSATHNTWNSEHLSVWVSYVGEDEDRLIALL